MSRKLISKLFLAALVIFGLGAGIVVVRQLNDLTDVGIKSPSANQVLTYVNGQWTNGTVTATSTNTSFYAKGTLINGGNIADSSTAVIGVSGTNVTVNPTNLPATLISSATLSDARLSTNVALLNGNGSWTGSNTYSGPSVFVDYATLKEKSAPAVPAPTNTVQLYAFDVSGTSTLRVLDDFGNIFVPAYLNAIQVWPEAQTFNGAITLGPGINITYPDNVRNTFNPGATVAGINVGSQAGNPSSPINGDLWYDSTANQLKARINTSTVTLGDTIGPSSSVDNSIVRFDSTSGKLIQGSAAILSDLADITAVNSATFSNTVTLTSLGANKTLITGSAGVVQGATGSDGAVLRMDTGSPSYGSIGNASITDLAWSKISAGSNSQALTNGNTINSKPTHDIVGWNGNNVSQTVDMAGSPTVWTTLTNNTTWTFSNVPTSTNLSSGVTLQIYNPSTFTGTFSYTGLVWVSKITTPTITTNGWTKLFFDWNGTNVLGTVVDAGSTNELGVPYGGSGTNTLVPNGVLYGDGTNPVKSTAQGAANSVLTANAGAPSFSQSPTINNAVQVGVASSQTGVLKLANASTANITSFAAGNAASALHYIWPVTSPSASDVLTAGAPSGTNVTLSWAAGGGGSLPSQSFITKFAPLLSDGSSAYWGGPNTFARVVINEEFMAADYPPSGWNHSPDGGGTGGKSVSVTNAPGIVFLSAATGGVDGEKLFFGLNDTDGVLPGSGEITVLSRVRFPTLSTSGERYTSIIGLSTGNFGPDDSSEHAVCAFYDESTSANWKLTYQNGSTITTNTSSTAVTTTWQWIGLKIDPTGTNAILYAGASLSAITPILTNTAATMPTSPIRPIINIRKSNSTASRSVELDYYGAWTKFTNAR